jgi:glycosyltransferase involved in cell wall biosynthesis
VLPWDGGRKSWPLRVRAVRRVLEEEARDADVWHTGCSRSLWNLTTEAYSVGQRCASGLRVLCLDSDPAEMRRRSAGKFGLRRPLDVPASMILRRSLERRAADADVVVMIGQGVQDRYGRFAKQSMRAPAVWLAEGELADEQQTREKFPNVDEVRIILPSRLEAWKGVDTAIEAAATLIRDDPQLKFRLDVIGSGKERDALVKKADQLGVLDRKVKFLDPVPYGEPFFSLLQNYHIALVPTQGTEEARVAFDALASGCVLIHSDTPTLSSAVEPLRGQTWRHKPGDAKSLAAAIRDCAGCRNEWTDAAIAGLNFMRGRTIDQMHRSRAEFLRKLRPAGVQRETVWREVASDSTARKEEPTGIS